ncbi:glycosyltransferase [Polaribacter aestuariivivens]|uniref:glycosyltransferase n=1 Tax=Polaribacter aestuariivivens TaxID=2304626 RepID=UPI003F49807D
MSSKKNILILSPFFYPELISTGKFNTDLARELAKQGHNITILCFHPFYPNWKTKKSEDFINNIKIIRGGKNIKYPKKQFLRRMVLEFSFSFFLLRKLGKHQKNKDIVIPVFPPSFGFYASLLFLNKKLKKVGMVHDLQEVYSKNKTGVLNKIIHSLIHKIEKKCYKNCDKLIFLSTEMKVKAKELYNLSEKNLEVQYPFINLKKTISNSLGNILNKQTTNIVYSGALGEKQNPYELYNFFDFASRKISNSQFYFFSQGIIFDTLKSKNKNPQINFHNLVNIEHLEELYMRSTVQIVPQKENTSKGSLPSKLPNLLFSGCKVLVITDKNSEIEKVFKSNGLSQISNSWSYQKLLNSLNLLLEKDTDVTHQKNVAKKLFTIEEMILKVLR